MLAVAEYARIGEDPFGVNVLAFSDIGGDNDLSACNTIAGFWADFVNSTLDQEIELLDGMSFVYPAAAPTDEIVSTIGGNTGGSTGDLAPLNCCYQVRTSAGGGRRRKGRIFLPGVDEAKVDNGGLLVGTTAADIADNFETFATAISTTAGFAPGVFSRLDGLVRIVQAIAVPGRVATQRRRMYDL